MLFKTWLVIFIVGFVIGLVLAGRDIYKKVKEEKKNEIEADFEEKQEE